jgi:hypothetical protein
MKDDPIQITDHLIEQHGADGALERVREGIETAHTDGDNYGLSVWREVSWILQKKRDAADAADAAETPTA